MTLVAFQDVNNFMRLGCYSLVETIEGSVNTQHGELSDLIKSNSERKVLFRSMHAGLEKCSCDLINKNVAIITLTNRQWQANRDNEDNYLQTSEPVVKCMLKISEAIEKPDVTTGYKKCLHCRIAKVLHRSVF